MKNLKNKQSGFSTIELLIAFAILVINITAVTLLVSGGQSVYIDSETNTEAIGKAEELIEQARAEGKFDFNLVNSSSSTETSGSLTYTKTLDVSQIDLFTKEVTGTVSWLAEGGRNLNIKFKTLLTNPEAALGGDTCSSVLDGDWKNPQLIPSGGYEFKDLIGESANGFSLTGIDMDKGKLYVTADQVPGSFHQDYTFFIFKVDDPADPPVYLSTGGVDNAPGVSTGLSAVKVVDDYAYVANGYGAPYTSCLNPTGINTSCGQLQVIDVSNSAVPKLKYTLKMPGVTGTGGQGKGISMFYKNGYAYLGLAKTASGPEFNIIDVSNPLLPVWKGGYNVGSQVNSIYVKDNYAYLATADNSRELIVLNISNPSSPTFASNFNPPGSTGFGNGKSIFKVGDKLFLGRTATKISGANDTVPEFYVLNASNPASIPVTPLVSLPLPLLADSINGLITRNNLAFFLTNKQFQVWNISNFASMVPWTPNGVSTEFLSLPSGSGTDLDCEGNYFYFASDSSQGNHKDLLAVIGPGVPSSYSISNNGNITATQGSSGNNTITRTKISGSPAGETLTVSGLPAGATPAWTNNPCAANCSSMLTISTTLATIAGTYPITVSSPSGLATNFNLIVNTFVAFDYTLSNSGNITVPKKSDGSTTITRTLVSGTTIPVTLSVTSVLPNAVTASFSTPTCNPTCSSTLTLSTKNQTPIGTFPITVTGSPNGIGPRTTTFNLIVTP